jgi:sugar phosphate isomerase/epimerase
LLENHVEYFHIKDVDVKTGELVPAGFGDGNIKNLIQTLKGKNAVLTIEPHLKVFEGYSNIDATEMKNRFEFKTNREAFDAAVSSLKKIILSCGYKEEKGDFIV